MDKTWKKAQEWELDWHGDCVNSFNEEKKQLEYASLMGLKTSPTHKTPYTFDMEGKTVLDIGGGAYSLLLKCRNLGESCVIDPLMNKYPHWVKDRYEIHGLKHTSVTGENFEFNKVFDEVWFYNVLEHVYDPKKIIDNAKKYGKIVRVFEWLNTPPNIGHPQVLKSDKLDKWLGGEGKITEHKRGNTIATSYSGIFKGDNYEEV